MMKTNKLPSFNSFYCLLLACCFQFATPILMIAHPATILQVQSESADDYVGTYAAEDTVIIIGSMTDTSYRSYTFTIVKIDSNHIAMYDFDGCAQDIGFGVTPTTFLFGGIPNNCGYYCSQPRGDKQGNVLFYRLTKCFGAPLDVTIFGKATKLPTSIAPVYSSQKFSVYPNPSNGKVGFYTDAKNTSDASIALYDIQGKKVFEQKALFVQGKLEIDIKSLQLGVYMWMMQTEEAVFTGKIEKCN